MNDTADVGDAPRETCEACRWWQDPQRGPETFEYAFGLAVYDIDAARRLVADGREAYDCPTDRLAAFVDYPAEPGQLRVFRTWIDPLHVGHVRADEPILLGYEPRPREGGVARQRLPIDGNHRIARALRDGRGVVRVYLLSEEETDRILTDRRPARRGAKSAAGRARKS